MLKINSKMTEEYFKVCAHFIPLLEEVRQANFEILVCKNELDGLSLHEIAQKIDYEKMCNVGLYSKHIDYP